MESFKLEIHNYDNAAMQDHETATAEILKKVAQEVEAGQESGLIRDYNGNTVGSFYFNNLN